MPSLKKYIRQLISPLCDHESYKHLQIFLMGNCTKQCIISLFITNKKVLCKEMTDRYYRLFFRLWLEYNINHRNKIKVFFNRMIMTKGFFLLLAYLYLLYRQCRITKFFQLYKLRYISWIRIEKQIKLYPISKLNKIFDNPTFVDFNDLHYFIFGQNLILPIPTHSNTPCMKLFSLRGHDEVKELFLKHNNNNKKNIYKLSLYKEISLIPCGNAMYAMGRSMVEYFCYITDRFLIPIDAYMLSPLYSYEKNKYFPKIISYALATTLKNCLVSSLITLPVTCFCKTKCMKSVRKQKLTAVICSKCGHCLNLGKEKLNFSQGFSLSSMFYFRDKQEKNIIYSTHSGIMYCSLCGSQQLTCENLYDIESNVNLNLKFQTVIWRAVIGTNAACAIFNETTKFDIVIPCSSRACLSSVKLTDINLNKLLKLISHSTEFQCQDCYNSFKETCLDNEEYIDHCIGCLISKQLRCHAS